MILKKTHLYAICIVLACTLGVSAVFNWSILRDLQNAVVVCGDLDARIRYLDKNP